jgi:hypothetical protein
MAAGYLPNDQAEALRREINSTLPYGKDWLVTPHQLLGGDTPVYTPTTTSRFSPGRLTAPAFEILYLAENPMVAMFEARALFGSPSTPGGVVPHPNRPSLRYRSWFL